MFLISGGVASVGGMIQGAFQGSFSFDLGFLGILIGRGLQMRKASERAWAVFVARCGIILIPVGGVLYIFSGDEPELILGLEPPGQTIVFAVYVYGVALFAFSFWMRKLPKIFTGFSRDKCGITRVRFSWISTGPVEVTVAADGYVPKDVQLTGTNDWKTIRVVLTREDWANGSAAKDHEERVPESQP